MAALLAVRGERPLLLEAHTDVGGCAGRFVRYRNATEGETAGLDHSTPTILTPESVGRAVDRSGRMVRDRFVFDVGATTLSGLRPGHSVDRLIDHIGSSPSMRKVDPGIIIHLDRERLLRRWSATDRWIAECEQVFGVDGIGLFWKHIEATADAGWNLAMNNPAFPPTSVVDLLSLAKPINILRLPQLLQLSRTVGSLVESCRIDRSGPFVHMLNELLMITAQSRTDRTPLLVGSMGLDYPADTWYVSGGMYGFCDWLAGVIRSNGGEIRTKHRVLRMCSANGGWRVDTTRGSFRADRVVANLMPDQVSLLLGHEQSEIGEVDRSRGWRAEEYLKSGPDQWGAITLYLTLPDSFDDGGTLYHQIHSDRLPWSASGSIFVSLSDRHDYLRAPAGWRTATISSHVDDPQSWIVLKRERPEEYRQRKGAIGSSIVRVMHESFSGLFLDERSAEDLLIGTPQSFAFYTGRTDGGVGGIPQDIGRSYFRMPSYGTPWKNLFVVGDCYYPGQGVPAVTLAGMNLVDALE